MIGVIEMVYLDYCATTPVSKELLDLYVDVTKNYIGNARVNKKA